MKKQTNIELRYWAHLLVDAGSWARTGSATDLTWNRLRCVASQTTGSVCWPDPAAGNSWTGWTVKRFGPPPDAAAASECSWWCWSLSGAGPLWKAIVFRCWMRTFSSVELSLAHYFMKALTMARKIWNVKKFEQIAAVETEACDVSTSNLLAETEFRGSHSIQST